MYDIVFGPQSAQVLMLDDNQLSALPESLGQLTKLERLSVAGNSLAALPPTLGGLKALKHLDVSRWA